MSLQGKIALVTGGADGIGFTTAIELLRNDIEGLVLTDINETLGRHSLKTLQNDFSADRIIFVKVDVTNEEEYEDAFKKAISTFGRLDIVFNNAGVLDEVDYCKTININLTGTLRGTILGLKYMSKEKGGSGGIILNTASMAAITTYVWPVYSASKFGVLGLSLNYGQESYFEKTDVRVMTLCPGFTETKLLLKHKPGDEYMEKILKDLCTVHPCQKVECVAKAAMYAINNGESGSAWVINGGKLYKLNFPDWLEMCELVKENM